MLRRMRATGTPEQDVDILADLFAQDLADWPEDTWLVFDDYQFAMEAKAPERLVELLVEQTPIRLVLDEPETSDAGRPPGGSSTASSTSSGGATSRWTTTRQPRCSPTARRPGRGPRRSAEGWPAVIGLAALTEQPTSRRGVAGALHDYFAEELFQAADPWCKKALCRLALAPSLAEGVAEFLLGENASQGHLGRHSARVPRTRSGAP